MKNSAVEQSIERMENAFRTLMPKLQNVLGEKFKSGLTGPQFYILRLLMHRGRLTVSELANTLYVKPSAITSMIDRLLKQELVVRERDEEDRRVVFIRISDQGKEMFDRMEQSRKKVLSYYFQFLQQEELEAMVGGFEKLSQIVTQVDFPAELPDNLRD